MHTRAHHRLLHRTGVRLLSQSWIRSTELDDKQLEAFRDDVRAML